MFELDKASDDCNFSLSKIPPGAMIRFLDDVPPTFFQVNICRIKHPEITILKSRHRSNSVGKLNLLWAKIVLNSEY
jgi:hypothetical protein